MRSRIVEDARPVEFRPFKMEITVENKKELASLWARFNMSGEVLAKAAQDRATNPPRGKKKKGPFSESFIGMISEDPPGKRDAWALLNERVKEEGISIR